MPIEPTNLYLDVYKADQDSESDNGPILVCCRCSDWALERHFSAEVAEHVATLRAEIDALKKAQAPYPFLHGVSDTKTMKQMHVNVRGNPHTLGDRCRNVSWRFCRRPIKSRLRTAAAAWSWPMTLRPARWRRA